MSNYGFKMKLNMRIAAMGLADVGLIPVLIAMSATAARNDTHSFALLFCVMVLLVVTILWCAITARGFTIVRVINGALVGLFLLFVLIAYIRFGIGPD